MARAAATLGRTADAERYSALAAQGAASFVSLYYDTSDGLFRDIECGSGAVAAATPCHNVSKDSELSVQTAQALPLFLGLPPSAAARQRVGDALAADVLNGTFPGRTTTGLVGTKYVERLPARFSYQDRPAFSVRTKCEGPMMDNRAVDYCTFTFVLPTLISRP